MTVNPTVLLVEPDGHFARILAAALEQSGWRVMQTSSGRRALSIYANERPDVIVTEADLDDFDAFELLDALRGFGPSSPVVVCTRLPGAGSWDRNALSSLGVKACISRPASLQAITRAVAECIAADLTEEAVYLTLDETATGEAAGMRRSRESLHSEPEAAGETQRNDARAR